ncbi:ACP S-malonyltransferase [Clostridium tagluense]|uniref:ACP S-malonyltransferase n=1 Tax=Clostridium tagluense TaxID=360422 RepID=UPI001CF53CFC|nr:ACP S-malonyltransferase [Clostridium tagluense]MCB2298649.1 ACP S-malonyltransferase [Clostridium tagluense]
MGKTAFIFPGQGCHHVGMGKALYEKYDVAKEIFNKANEALSYDIKKVCFEGNLAELSRIDIMLPAILTVSVASFHVLVEEYGVIPNFLAGHSLGEYSALTCSGAIDFYDAVKLVQKRSQLAVEAFQNKDATMSIVENIDFNTINSLCLAKTTKDSVVSIGCINGKTQFSICGDGQAVMEVENELLIKGATVTPLIYSLPFHSPLMENVSIELEQCLKKVKISPFKYPVISNFDAKVYVNESEIIPKLVKQIRYPVQWYSIVEFLRNSNVENLIEVGSQKILNNLIGKDFKNFNLLSFNVAEDREKINEMFSSENKLISNEEHRNMYIKFMEACLGEAVATKNNCFDEKLYEINIINKYLQIENWINNIRVDSNLNYVEIAGEILNNLKCIYDTKGINISEQYDRFNGLLGESTVMDVYKPFIDEIFTKAKKVK